MSKPIFVTIPHHLGRDEAVRRLKSGLSTLRTSYGHLFSVQEESWTDNRLQIRVSALAQVVSGTVEVFDDHVNLEVSLPWLLAALAEKIQPLIRKEGAQMLEKK